MIAMVAMVVLAGMMAGMMASCAPRLHPLAIEAGNATIEPRIGEAVLHAPDGHPLPLRVWRPDTAPQAIIAALHGFNDHAGAFDEAATFWAEQGIATYAIDQRGFGAGPHPGLWPGMETLRLDALALMQAARREHPGLPVILLGESMGGAVAITLLARSAGDGPDGAILVAPAVLGRRHIGPVGSAMLWLGAHSLPWLRLRPEIPEIVPSDNLPMLRRLAADPLVLKETRIDTAFGLVRLMDTALEEAGAAAQSGAPILLTYGGRDDLIGAPPMREAAAALAAHGARIAFYPDGHHMLLRDLEAHAVWEDVAAWIGNPGRTLPSGAEDAARLWIGSPSP